MLISIDEVKRVLDSRGVHVDGILHVGAHECEELHAYTTIGVNPQQVVWIDAIPSKVNEAQQRGIPNVYHAVITDKDDEGVVFHISNNGQSSSVLEFGTHAQEHPWVVYVDTLHQRSLTLDTFFQRAGLDPSRYSLWNFDIQGAELLALKGATQSLQYAKALYLEVNANELYKGCALLPEMDGFLSNHGFYRVLTNMTHHGWGDALYIRM